MAEPVGLSCGVRGSYSHRVPGGRAYLIPRAMPVAVGARAVVLCGSDAHGAVCVAPELVSWCLLGQSKALYSSSVKH